MRVIRSAGQNVSPSDDGRLFDQIFTDGLFEETTITHLGANNVALGAMYGIICGRDFTAEAQTVAVELPEDDAGTTGYIYVEIDTSSDDVITIGTALAPFTPTYEDLNTNGAVAQMIIAEYVASSVAITSLTPNYVMATSGSVLPGSVATVETSPAVANHSVGEFILYGGQLYSVTAAISVGESLTPGTNISATSAGAELSTLKNGLTDVENEVDALHTSGYVPVMTTFSQSGTDVSYTIPSTGLYAVRASTGSTAGTLSVYMFNNAGNPIATVVNVNAPAWATIFTPPIPLIAGTIIKAQFDGPNGSGGAIVKYAV